MAIRDQVVWEKISVDKEGDKESTIVHRGADVPDFVDEYTKSVLRSIGATRSYDDGQDPAGEAPAKSRRGQRRSADEDDGTDGKPGKDPQHAPDGGGSGTGAAARAAASPTRSSGDRSDRS